MMPTRNRIATVLTLAAVTIAGLAFSATAQAGKPLKVYILAGQSNMEGHAKITTFDYIGDDPKTAPLLKEMRDPDGKPHVCDHVWITYLHRLAGPRHAGRGVRQADGRVRLTREPQGDEHGDRPGVHVRPDDGEGLRRPDPDHQDGLGRQEPQHGLPPAQRRALQVQRGRSGELQEARQGRRRDQGREGQGHRPVLQADDRPREEGARRSQAGLSRVRPEGRLRGRRVRVVPGLERHVRRRHVSRPGQAGRVRRVFHADGRLHPRRAQGHRRAEDAVRDRRDRRRRGEVHRRDRESSARHGGAREDAGIQGQRRGRGDRTVLGLRDGLADGQEGRDRSAVRGRVSAGQ